MLLAIVAPIAIVNLSVSPLPDPFLWICVGICDKIWNSCVVITTFRELKMSRTGWSVEMQSRILMMGAPFGSARILVFLMFANQSPLRAIVWSPRYTDPPSCTGKQAMAPNICCSPPCCVFFVVSNGQERYDTHSCAISFCGLPWRSTFPVFIFVKRTLALAGASETGHPKRGLCPARATT